MRNFFMFLSLIYGLLLTSPCRAQLTKFQRAYGGTGNDNARAFPTSDGGYIFSGTKDFSINTGDIFLVKTDSIGDTLWTRTFSGAFNPSADEGRYIIQTYDGGYLLSGYIQYDSINRRGVLIKTDSNGDTLWTRSGMGGATIIQTKDSGYATFSSAFLTKLDMNCNIQWSKVIKGYLGLPAWGIKQTNDGGFILLGETKKFSAGGPTDEDLYLVKTDSLGNLLWAKGYGTTAMEYAGAVDITNSSGYIMVGTTYINQANSMEDVLYIKVDSVGNLIYSKRIDAAYTDGGVYVIEKTGGANDIIVGMTQALSNEIPPSSYKTFMLLTDLSGNILWSRTYGVVSPTSGNDQATMVSNTPSGGFMMSGWTGSSGAGLQDAWLIKTDASGVSGCNEYVSNPVAVNQTIIITPGGTDSTRVISPGHVPIIVGTTGFITTCICPGITGSSSATVVSCSTCCDGTATANPSGYTYSWSPTGQTTQTATGLCTGTYTVVISDGSCSSTVSVAVTYNASISSLENDNTVIIFPNPTNGIFTIKNEKLKIKNVEVYNLLGEQIQKLAEGNRQSANNSSVAVDISTQPDGIYFVRVNTDRGMVSKKVVLMR